MSSVLMALANGAAVSALLTAGVWFVLWMTPRSRLNAATRYAIWWATLAVVLALPLLLVQTRHLAAASEAQATVPTIRVVHSAGSAARPLVTMSTPAETERYNPLQYPKWILGTWLAISLLLLGRLAVSWVLLDRQRRRAVPAEPSSRSLDRWLAASKAGRKGIQLASSTEIAVPVAVGPIHPSILLPARLLVELEEDDLGRIVMHEGAHLARRDDYGLLVQRGIEALFALHPVVRWITRQLDLEREVACDDFVVEATGQARSYADCLTRMVELCGGLRASLACAPAVSDRSHLAVRVDRLLDKGRHTGTHLLKSRLAGMVALLVVAVWTAGKAPVLLAFAAPMMPAAAVPSTSVAAATPATPTPAVAAVEEPAMPAATEASAASTSPEPQVTAQASPTRVLVPVTVTDPLNRIVTGLGRESFRLFDDGVEQQNFDLSSQELPISMTIVVDGSGSMRDRLDVARQAVTEILTSARPSDEFALVTFNDTVTLTVPLTHDVAAIQAGLQGIQPRGGTALRDAIFAAIHEMKRSHNQRQAIVIVSDGEDNTSLTSAAALKAGLQEADYQYFAINLADRPRTRAFAGIQQAMEEINGFDQTETAATAPRRAGQIAANLRNLYMLSFTPLNAVRDGKYRRVQVEVVPPAGIPPLRVHYRAGYYAQ